MLCSHFLLLKTASWRKEANSASIARLVACMLTVLSHNFDVLGDVYSLPGVWGLDHLRLPCTMLELTL